VTALTKVAVLGLGAMGARMAARLIAAGYAVTVWNRTAERAEPLVTAGARPAETPREAASGAEVIIAVLRDDEASRAVWLDRATGAMAGVAAGAIAVESSTLSLAWMRTLGAAFRRSDAAFLEAPVVGSRPQAEAGQLIHLVGGDPDVLGRVAPVLATIGAARHWCGAVGSGAAMKLAVNGLFGIQVAAVAEWLGLLGRIGLDPARAVDILAATPVLSPAAKGAAASTLAREFAPMFPVELAGKDFAYALAAAADAERGIPVTAAVHRVIAAAIAAGFGGANLTGIARLYG